MTVDRVAIVHALDDLIAHEEGSRFQALAVVLVKQKWREFIACERKNDLGLDAHLPATLARNGRGQGLASSLTATVSKIKADAEKVRQHYPDVQTLIFATPVAVTREKAKRWAAAIQTSHGHELFVISREDIIADLLLPANVAICRAILRIPVVVEAATAELLQKAREATTATLAAWLAHPRLAGKPRIELRAAPLDYAGQESGGAVDHAAIDKLLLEGRRIVLEAAAGQGKTTTLIQLAMRQTGPDRLQFLVDMPGWISRNESVLDFIARMPAFRARGITADHLAKLSETVPCSFLLNGWNEVSERASIDAVRALSDLDRCFPVAGVILATRTHYIRPVLPGAVRLKLLALSRQQRADYVSQALASRAHVLHSRLTSDATLDALTRTPFVLAEVTTLFASGAAIPATKLAVLAAVIRVLEQTEEHGPHLETPPLSGHASLYLGALAVAMTTSGSVTLSSQVARTIVHSVSCELRDATQIATVPEPVSVLNLLCAHHVLERTEYPSVAFRFQHQQFQEFYVALFLQKELVALRGAESSDLRRRTFAEKYVNRPVFEEPLRMLATDVGRGDTGALADVDIVAIGRLLVEISLTVDALFSAELVGWCGTAAEGTAWATLSQRLRAWHRVSDENHQRCALAAILATGSDEFMDILLPLLTSGDPQLRLRTYRAWGEFHLSSLGSNWRHVVAQWDEECRQDFIGEALRNGTRPEVAEDFACNDPSPRVRLEAIRVLSWVGATEPLTRVLAALDDPSLAEVLQDGIVDTVPPELRERAFATYLALSQSSPSAAGRLRAVLGAAQIAQSGDREVVADAIRRELGGWAPGRVDDATALALMKTLETLRSMDPDWVSDWVATRVLGGSLGGGHWIRLVSGVSEGLRQDLLQRISTEDVAHDTQEIADILMPGSRPEFAGRVFSLLSNIQRMMLVPTGRTELNAAILRQLSDLLRALPPNLAVSGMLSGLSGTFEPVQFRVVIEVLGRLHPDPEGFDLRDEISNDVRQVLRGYLRSGLAFTLSEEDYSGHLKVHLAVTMGRVGDASDMDLLRQLIDADLERMRQGRAARLRRQRGPLVDGGGMSYTNWYLRAVTGLDPEHADGVVLELLKEPEYENGAAGTLVRLARTRSDDPRSWFRGRDYGTIWDAREGRSADRFDESRRARYAEAVKRRIAAISEERSASPEPKTFNGRLKSLAGRLAALDGPASADLVIHLVALPGEWDAWPRTSALEALIFSGARPPADAALQMIEPAIDEVHERALHDQQNARLLTQTLALLPFLDNPSRGIERIRAILRTVPFPAYQLREVITALGHSRSDEALTFLLELATASGPEFQSIAGEWIDAVAVLDTPRSRTVLLGFLDPSLQQVGLEQYLEYHHRDLLSSRLADIVRRHDDVKARVFALVNGQQSPAQRLLSSSVLVKIGSGEGFAAALSGIRDNANPPIPLDLQHGLDQLFVAHRPHGDSSNAYTLEPRSADDIRTRLFDMVLRDNTRKRSAFALLGQIEVWRLEYGRPGTEPRHPALNSNRLWPPINDAGQLLDLEGS